MKTYHLVAMTETRVIGKDNRLPWHYSEDLKRFKALTLGQTVIMGRKTFDSIGKPLPGRENFVLSRSAHAKEEIKFFKSVDDALKAVKTEKAFIIGGAEIFKQTMNQVDGILLTLIKKEYEGDTFYPEIPTFFKETKKEKSKENPELEFIDYLR